MAEILPSRKPHSVGASEHGISADTAGIGRREYPNVEPNTGKDSSVGSISAEDSLSVERDICEI
jgi:hypothetical protein